MKSVEYSQLVKRKLLKLKKELAGEYGEEKNFIYRIEAKKVVVVQMFNEREDFMMKLFGISGRTQESIDYWGE